MTGVVELLALAAWCEAAAGPDRLVDQTIGWIAGTQRWSGPQPDYGGPRYTEGLDAALSLVPEGWIVGLGDLRGRDPIVWRAHLRDHNDPDEAKRQWVEGHAATPALALTAAALKARAQKERSDG